MREADRLMHQVLIIYKKALGEHHPLTQQSRQNLAVMVAVQPITRRRSSR